METSSSLAIESFSHSWLRDTRFSIDDDPIRKSLYLYDDDDEPTSDHHNCWKLGISNRFSQPQNHNFNFHSAEFPPPIAHADEIFSNGKILPVYRGALVGEDPKASRPVSPIPSTAPTRNDDGPRGFIVKWKRSSKRALAKYLELLKPACSKLGCSREGVKVDDFDRKLWEMNSLDGSPRASPPQRRDVFVGDPWFDVMAEKGYESDDFERNLRKAKSWSHFSPRLSPGGDWSVESSIYEAILHCKRSCGTFMIFHHFFGSVS